MDRKKLLKILAYLIFFIFVVHFFANIFYWYYSIWYFDMPMHFLGGFWWGLVLICFLFSEESDFRLISKVILSVLVIGILWELYEVLFYNYLGQNPFDILDTLSDVLFDLAGGSFAILYFFKRIVSIKENTIHPVVEL